MKTFGCCCRYALLLLVALYAAEGATLRQQRQAGRYGGPNYRPGPGYNTAVRGGSGGGNVGNIVGGGINSPLSGAGSLKGGPVAGTTRPLGVGAFSYGGGGGGGGGGARPGYGPSFALNSGGSIGHRPQQQQPQVAALVSGGGGRPQPGGVYRGAPALGRPSGNFQYN